MSLYCDHNSHDLGMLNMYSIFFRKIRKRVLLDVLGVFGMLLIGIASDPIAPIKDLPTQINNLLFIVIIFGSTFCILSVYSFYEFLAQYFLFRKDLLKLFPLTYLFYLCFWAIVFGLYYVFKLDYDFLPFTPDQWNYEIITASFGLALLTTSGFSWLKRFHPSFQEENRKVMTQFREAHSTFVDTIISQRKMAKTDRNGVQTANKEALYKHLKDMERALQNIISTEAESGILTRYEKLLKSFRILTDENNGIAKLELIHYISLLRRDPVTSLEKYNDVLDSIKRLSAY